MIKYQPTLAVMVYILFLIIIKYFLIDVLFAIVVLKFKESQEKQKGQQSESSDLTSLLTQTHWSKRIMNLFERKKKPDDDLLLSLKVEPQKNSCLSRLGCYRLCSCCFEKKDDKVEELTTKGIKTRRMGTMRVATKELGKSLEIDLPQSSTPAL
jgi:hypothetical protein